eukprot:scaffold358300_cov50-Prasinocladus_malaysianus.AAC.2
MCTLVIAPYANIVHLEVASSLASGQMIIFHHHCCSDLQHASPGVDSGRESDSQRQHMEALGMLIAIDECRE